MPNWQLLLSYCQQYFQWDPLKMFSLSIACLRSRYTHSGAYCGFRLFSSNEVYATLYSELSAEKLAVTIITVSTTSVLSFTAQLCNDSIKAELCYSSLKGGFNFETLHTTCPVPQFLKTSKYAS